MRRILWVMALLLCIAPLAFAQSGHFIESGAQAPTCADIGTQVACGGKVAGLGGTTFEITVEAEGLAIVECENFGGNVAPGQDTSVDVHGTSGPLPTPKNGNYVFSVSTAHPTVPNDPTCPNPRWTAHVVDVQFTTATLTLFEDGMQVDQVIVPVQ